jgi:hypothetical protein
MSSSADAQESLNVFLSQLNDRVAQLETHPAPAVLPAVPVNPKTPMPEKFEGKISKYRDFLASVKNYFVLQGFRYPTDETKIRFIGTLLSGDPLTWFRTLIESDSAILLDMELFIKEFQANYDDPYVQSHAQTAIRRLKQGKNSVVTYAAKFRRLAADTGYNSDAKVSMFRSGLNDDVKDVLSTALEEPTEFEDFINYCIKIDHRIYDRRLEKKNASSHTHGDPHPKKFETPRSGPTTPMDLDGLQEVPKHKKLTKEERERRIKEKLCLYCGESGHRVSRCPNKPKN